MIQRFCQLRKRGESDSGFTLIELLVVIVILGILAAVVVFAVRGVGDKGKSSALATDVKTLRTAQEAYCAKNGHYGTEADLVNEQFLSEASKNHDTVPTVGGSCKGAGIENQSGFLITCQSTLAGCGAGGATPTGGVLRVAGGDTTGGNFVNPASTTSGGAHGNVEYMFNGLLRWAEDNTAQPDLAESFTISADQKTALFTLRPGLTWHDGQAITANDVNFTFRQALIKFHGRTQGSMAPAFGIAPPYNSATTLPAGAITMPDGPGGLRVQLNYTVPYAPLLRQMNVTEAPIIPEHVYNVCATAGNINGTGCTFNNPSAGDFPPNAPVGSGPFKFKSRNTATNALVLVKNPAYHRPGLPAAAELQQSFYSTQTLATDALQANAVDVATVAGNRLPPLTGPTIVTAPAFQTAIVPRGSGGGNCILTWGFNLWQKGKTPGAIQADIAANPATKGDHPIFSDQTLVDPDGAGPEGPMARGLVVRKALTMGLDRDLLFNNIEFGKGRVADSAYHSKLAGYVPQTLPAFNTTTAATWLQNAGWTDPGGGGTRVSSGAPGMPAAGTPLTFNMHGFSTGTQAQYYTQIANQLQAAPVQVNVTSIETAAGPGPEFGTRPWDSMLFSVCHGDDPVIGARRTMHTSQISSTAFTNMSGYHNTTVDNLWDTAFGANYASNHAQIQSIVVGENPMVWISETASVRAWKSSCAGFNNQNTGLFVEGAGCS